jgi:CHAT domain-containing protein
MIVSARTWLTVVVLLLLAGCVANDGDVPGQSTSGQSASRTQLALAGETSTSDVCADIASGLRQARQKNFFGEYADAEIAISGVSLYYGGGQNSAALQCPNAPPSAIVFGTQALIYSNQRLFQRAEAMFQRAEAARTDNIKVGILPVFRLLDRLNRVALAPVEFDVLARDVDAMLQTTEGGKFVAQLESQDLFLGQEDQLRLLRESVALFSLAAAAGEQRRYGEAEVWIDEALSRARFVPSAATNFVPRYMTQKAIILQAQGRHQEALNSAVEGIEGFPKDRAESALMGRALAVQSRILSSLGQDDASLAASNAAMQAFSKVTVPVSYEVFYHQFALAEKAMMKTDDETKRAALFDDIFLAAQVVRSQSTARSVSAANAAFLSEDGALSYAVRRYNAADAAVIFFEGRVARAESAVASRAMMTSDLRKIEKEYRKVIQDRDVALAAVVEVAPEGFSLVAASTTRQALQAVLQPGEAFVQIMVGDPRSVVLVVTMESAEVYPITALRTADIARIVADARASLRPFDERGPASPGSAAPFDFFQPNEVHRLYSAIFAPLEGRMANIEQFVFSVTGPLSTFPMEVLPLKPATAMSDGERIGFFEDVEWFGLKYRVMYTPAPRNLVELRNAPPTVGRANLRVAAFGEFVPGGMDIDLALQQAALPNSQACRKQFSYVNNASDLPGTRLEIATLRKQFGDGVTAWTGSQFNEQELNAASVSGKLRDFDIIHFATHGVIPTAESQCITNPGLSVSVEPGSSSDGLLTDREILDLDLGRVSLVLLSACETFAVRASGQGADSSVMDEGLSTMARAFLSSGASNVLATHWPLAEEAAPVYVETFYAEAKKGRSLAEAHRLALRSVILNEDKDGNRLLTDPYFWGPFVLIGDGNRTLKPPLN